MSPNPGGKNRNHPRNKWVSLLKRFIWFLAAIFLLFFVIIFAYAYVVMQGVAPRIHELNQLNTQILKEPTLILSADGEVLYRMATERREPVSWREIPKAVIDATVAAEDRRFWEHEGVDFRAILRALWVNLRSRSVRQGGSTITQQVAKRLLTTGERSFRRKMEDACLALLMERELTKEQIITLYLNEIYYGSGAYGIKAAADVYFGKDLDELTIGEAALLARLPRRPSDENPFVDPQAAIANRNYVLRIMREEGWITEKQYQQAIREPLNLAKRQQTHLGIIKAPYFVTYVLDQLQKEFPNEEFSRGGYRIETTLRWDCQKLAEDAVERILKEFRKRKVTEGAIVITSYSGEILAMVGGSDFKRSQYNAITQGRRQPGSAFKPIVYATAFELGALHPAGTVSNEPIVVRDRWTGKVWKPRGGGTGGTVSVRTAIVRSINVPAVHAIQAVGPTNVARFAKEVFGINSPLDPVLPLALGSSAVHPLELVSAYSVFATGGNRVEPFALVRVRGPDGKIVREYQPRIVKNVLSASTAEAMRDILRDVVLYGTGYNARSVLNAAGKTGTTNDHRDAWFCGFTDRLIAVAWVANATYDPSRTPSWRYNPMPGMFGGTVAAKLWAYALKPIQTLLKEKPSEYRASIPPLPPVERKVSVAICSDSEQRAIPGKCPNISTRQLTEEEANALEPCPLHKSPSKEKQDTTPPEEAPPATPPPVTGPPVNPPPVTFETVEVEVCLESGDLATTYCPVKRPQKFRKGFEPQRTCRIHRP
jgi:penicillin-binding protein 1A